MEAGERPASHAERPSVERREGEPAAEQQQDVLRIRPALPSPGEAALGEGYRSDEEHECPDGDAGSDMRASSPASPDRALSRLGSEHQAAAASASTATVTIGLAPRAERRSPRAKSRLTPLSAPCCGTARARAETSTPRASARLRHADGHPPANLQGGPPGSRRGGEGAVGGVPMRSPRCRWTR
jgi:hypothetical protein